MKELTEMKNTMTLKDITDLLTVQHSKAMKTVEVMSKDVEFGSVAIMDTVYNTSGQTIKTYLLNKRQSIAVAAKLNTPMLMKVIDRWQELEQGNLPKTLLEALKFAVIREEKLLRVTGENQNLHIAIDNHFGYCSILRASQHVGVHENTFSWRVLKPKAIHLNLPPKKVPSPRYQYQLLYPLQAFIECYPEFDYEGIVPHDFIEIGEIK